MQCELCQKAEASIVFTTIAGDNKVTTHLCPDCASLQDQQQGAVADAAAVQNKVHPKAQSSVVKPSKTANVVVGRSASRGKAAACPGCGMTYEEFRKVGRLGCSQCYQIFAKPLGRLLKRIHGADRHVGRAPGMDAVDAADDDNGDVERLRMELTQAVNDEDYERAAELRDHIAGLKQ